MRMSSVELHQKLGQAIDRARVSPVVVTRHDRDHVVILSAERYAAMEHALRHARLTGSLSAQERERAASATAPDDAGQAEYLRSLAVAMQDYS